MNIRFLTTALLLTCVLTGWAQHKRNDFVKGADVSGLPRQEQRGVVFHDRNGKERECLELLKNDYQMQAIRLRVWVEPTRDGSSTKEDVLRMALRAKQLGMDVMIDFHYSDWWADPGKQYIPKQWEDMTYEKMRDALYEHTLTTLQLLKDNGISVKWVQVGNETTNGFLWDMGRAQDNMEQYAGFTQAGYEAVKAVYPDAVVIVHLDAACDLKRYDFIFEGLKKYGAKWDMIGMSVYPYWDKKAHLEKTWKGTVRDMCANIRTLAERYGCPLMIVETGVEAKKPNKGYRILKEIIRAAQEDCNGYCQGVFYWAPEAEGHYPLGAFRNHKPTKIMKAFSR